MAFEIMNLNGGIITRASTVKRSGPKRRRLHREASTWKSVSNGWRQMYGNFEETGVSIESHEFLLSQSFDWSRSFHPRSLELCLNIEGEAMIRNGAKGVNFKSGTAGFYSAGENGLRASREAGQSHRFITIEFSASFLRSRLSASDGALNPAVENFLRNPGHAETGPLHRLTAAQEKMTAELVKPPVVVAARDLWYQSKVLELMVEFFFVRPSEDEFFCDRQKRLARERVEKASALLRERLAEPPTLDEIGRAAGCSPFYLSRTFSQEMGMTIPQYVRKLRVERAAQLLRSGKYNVTEAAVEVGYSSLSHFSQAFCQIMGCCPVLYPPKTIGVENQA
jgi:AraC family transcriptional regulator